MRPSPNYFAYLLHFVHSLSTDWAIKTDLSDYAVYLYEQYSILIVVSFSHPGDAFVVGPNMFGHQKTMERKLEAGSGDQLFRNG